MAEIYTLHPSRSLLPECPQSPNLPHRFARTHLVVEPRGIVTGMLEIHLGRGCGDRLTYS
jgi:hypothetical protein